MNPSELSKNFQLSEKRKLRYETDPEYKQKRLSQSRETYRKSNGVELFSCLSRIPEIGANGWGEVRPVVRQDSSPYGDHLCLTMAEFGDIVGGHSTAVIYRWQSKGLIPETVALATITMSRIGRSGGPETYDQNLKVYLAEEAAAIMRVLGEHQRQVRYFRERDSAVIDAISAAVMSARGQLRI